MSVQWKAGILIKTVYLIADVIKELDREIWITSYINFFLLQNHSFSQNQFHGFIYLFFKNINVLPNF